ncbi:hypothetical protein N9N67_00665 [Bacteriovoracaceae bacterium]|nr:hypothetical protein [Bacteriovoracaceae bacterium]
MQNTSMLLYNMTEKILSLTLKVLQDCEIGETENLTEDLNNRERLIGVLNYLQDKLSKEPTNINKQLIEESNRILGQIEKLDIQIVDSLEKIKEETNSEIAKVYKTKENFRGYNLKNTK